jgi:4'-phosphopantetheinyl transferase
MNKNTRFMETISEIEQLPALSADVIHIWGVHVSDMQDRIGALYDVLCEKEQQKAARFYRDSDRHSSIVARGALRILLSAYTGIPATEINFHYSETGKPHVKGSDVDFNVSHSSEWVVLAIGCNRQIGVDIEMIKREMDVMSVASRYFTSEEIALIEKAEDRHMTFFQLWARKEAYVKACGSTLFRELSSFAVPTEEQGEKDGWYFHRLEAGSKYAAAVVTDKKPATMPCYDFGGLKWDS